MMEKLTDPNPYEILGVGLDADRQSIKRALAERQRSAKDQASRQQATVARNTLFSTEKRLLIDSMMPDFVGGVQQEELAAEHSQSDDSAPVWRTLLNEEALLGQDLRALTEATIRYTLGEVPSPKHQIVLSSEFDGLDGFFEDWMNPT